MGEKKTRNKFKDGLFDYYKTNKQIQKTEREREAQETESNGGVRKVSNREKSMVQIKMNRNL